METERIECPIELIEAYFSELEHILTIEKIPSMFVINIDEAGFAEWADAMKLTVIGPSDFDDESIKIPVARAGKRASLLAAICADGTSHQSTTLGTRTAQSRIQQEEDRYWGKIKNFRRIQVIGTYTLFQPDSS